MAGTKKQRLAVIVGANITARRKLLGWNQAAFAERLGMGADSLSRAVYDPGRSGEVPDQLFVPKAGRTADRH